MDKLPHSRCSTPEPTASPSITISPIRVISSDQNGTEIMGSFNYKNIVFKQVHIKDISKIDSSMFNASTLYLTNNAREQEQLIHFANENLIQRIGHCYLFVTSTNDYTFEQLQLIHWNFQHLIVSSISRLMDYIKHPIIASKFQQLDSLSIHSLKSSASTSRTEYLDLSSIQSLKELKMFSAHRLTISLPKLSADFSLSFVSQLRHIHFITHDLADKNMLIRQFDRTWSKFKTDSHPTPTVSIKNHIHFTMRSGF